MLAGSRSISHGVGRQTQPGEHTRPLGLGQPILQRPCPQSLSTGQVLQHVGCKPLAKQCLPSARVARVGRVQLLVEPGRPVPLACSFQGHGRSPERLGRAGMIWVESRELVVESRRISAVAGLGPGHRHPGIGYQGVLGIPSDDQVELFESLCILLQRFVCQSRVVVGLRRLDYGLREQVALQHLDASIILSGVIQDSSPLNVGNSINAHLIQGKQGRIGCRTLGVLLQHLAKEFLGLVFASGLAQGLALLMKNVRSIVGHGGEFKDVLIGFQRSVVASQASPHGCQLFQHFGPSR